MNETQPSRVSELIPKKVLGACLERIENHRNLLKTIKQTLPPPLADRCLDCVAGNDILVLYAESGAWTAQLRFYLPKIIETLASSGQGRFRQGKVKTLHMALEASCAAPPRPAHNWPVPQTIAALEAAAQTSDSEIGAALLRLCGTLRRVPR
ncbi:MAG: DUF721 domain-containing protein [Methylococcus sp.]|nr:DUF721 domain-containing protein [Methylococcus sp.]